MSVVSYPAVKFAITTIHERSQHRDVFIRARWLGSWQVFPQQVSMSRPAGLRNGRQDGVEGRSKWR